VWFLITHSLSPRVKCFLLGKSTRWLLIAPFVGAKRFVGLEKKIIYFSLSTLRCESVLLTPKERRSLILIFGFN
jgi:hypothetical protein